MGFSSALLELSQIQHGDSYLREELEENRRSCQKKALRMEALVETLRVRLPPPGRDQRTAGPGSKGNIWFLSLQEELGVMRCQILQLYSNKQRPLQDAKSSTLKQKKR